MKLNSLKLALSAAIVNAILMFLLPLYGMYLGRGLRLTSILGGVFPGYTVSWQGAGLGAAYGFVICFIYAGLIAVVYNNSLGWKGLKLKAKKAKKAAKKKK